MQRRQRIGEVRARGAHRGRGGFSLLELSVAVIVLVIALGSLSGTILSSAKLTRVNEESAIAHQAARGMATTLQEAEFSEVFRLYNENAADDPDGPGTAPGSGFAVDGLALRTNDDDGLAGRILFPTVLVDGDPVPQLREDVDEPRLGMPRDLDGDGLDALDHAPDDYIVLPVSVLVEWRGSGGLSQVRLDLVLTR